MTISRMDRHRDLDICKMKLKRADNQTPVTRLRDLTPVEARVLTVFVMICIYALT